MKQPVILRHALRTSAVVLVLVSAFVAFKTYRVAKELVDPPFYRVPSLSIVEETYGELAGGGGGDPGGRWETMDSGGLQIWSLKRHTRTRGTVLLLHGFGDDRWGTSPALRWFPELDAAIFTYLRRDDAKRAGGPVPPVTFGARECEEVVRAVHALETSGLPRNRIVLMGRSLGASVGLLALARLEREGKGPLGGIVWEGAPASSRDFGERLVRGSRDRFWHPLLAPLIGDLGSRWAARSARYDRDETDLGKQLGDHRFRTPSLCFLATQDRLAPPEVQRWVASHFEQRELIAVPTWHLQCSERLGPRYGAAIHEATRRWLP